MGNICSSEKQDQRNSTINEQLTKMRDQDKREVKILLLGAGESGKSTFFKQMRIIHNLGFTQDERSEWTSMIRNYCIESLVELVHGASKLKLLSEEVERNAHDLIQNVNQFGLPNQTIAHALSLWRSPEMQIAFQRRSEFQLADSVQHFFNNLDRIFSVDFVPTYEDILLCRVRTTGVAEVCFSADGADFRLVDVGGQRSERRKWIHCFDNVEAVLFIVAISEYNQVLFEDEKTNRLKEAIRVYAEVCNTKFFSSCTMILFLNKRDLFVEKIQQVDLNVCFPQYQGGCSYENAVQFIREQFEAIKPTKRELYVHVTTATDTGNISFVFDSVKESILLQNMNGSGIL